MGRRLHILRTLRPTVAWAMVVSVLLTSIHCTLHAAESVVPAAQSLTSHTPDGPLREAPMPCEQESGCLCRGAILAKSVEPPCIFGAGDWIRKLAITSAPQFSIVTSAIVASAGTKLGIDGPPSISGRALRAWVSSLQC